MPVFCILRRTFVDRHMTFDDLAALPEMLRQWYQISCAVPREAGTLTLEASIHSLPLPAIPTIKQSLASRFPAVTFDLSDPQVLTLIGPATKCTEPSDISLWRDLLADPQLQDTCILLRVTIRGPMYTFALNPSEGASKFEFYGSPLPDGFLLKAVWKLGLSEKLRSLFRTARWNFEAEFMEAFELYRQKPNNGVASLTLFELKKGARPFNAREDEKANYKFSRQRYELEEDQNLGVFLASLAPSLGMMALLLVVIALARQQLYIVAVAAVITTVFVVKQGVPRVRKKFNRISNHRRAFHKLWRIQFSGTLEVEPVDLSNDRTPTLIKFSQEMLALGATHLSDLKTSHPQRTIDVVRIYALDSMVVSASFLKGSETLQIFPAKPIIDITTRFVDGRRHFTRWTHMSRKVRTPGVTAQSMMEQGGLAEMVSQHRRHVEQLVQAGAVPLLLKTSQDVMEAMKKQHELAGLSWHQYSYTWADAFRDTFNITLREYRD